MAPLALVIEDRTGHTMQLGHVHAELVTLFKDAFTPLGDKVIESVGELGHALAELIETKVNTRESVGHRGGGRRGEGWA